MSDRGGRLPCKGLKPHRHAVSVRAQLCQTGLRTVLYPFSCVGLAPGGMAIAMRLCRQNVGVFSSRFEKSRIFLELFVDNGLMAFYFPTYWHESLVTQSQCEGTMTDNKASRPKPMPKSAVYQEL